MQLLTVLIFLFDSLGLIQWGGFLIIAILTFLETGLLVGLIVPGGETLLFTAGILTSTGGIDVKLYTLLLVLIGAGLLGDISGYYIGKKFGPALNKKKDTWYFKRKYLEATKKYYDEHKYTALIFGKFLPVVRPFNPVLAGMSEMYFLKFFLISCFATVIYISGFTLLGYSLGQKFPQISDYLPWIIPVSIAIAIFTVIKQIRKNTADKD